MDVDHDDRISHSRPHLRVPAVAPRIAERSVRTAVNQESHRVLVSGLEIHRLHDVSLDGLVVPAGKRERLVPRHWCLRQRVLAHVSERALRVFSDDFEDLRRAAE